MIKKGFLWLLLFAALVLSGSALFAQAPAGPEKVMIYNGESLKIQLTGDIKLNMVQNKYNVNNDTYGLWVNNQKWGYPIFSYALAGPYGLKGTQAVWLPFQKVLSRGSLFFDTRYTQLGLTIAGPGLLGGTSFGRIEVDFYGGFGTTAGNVSRQPLLRMRNAFAGLAWDKEMFGVKITFGQYTSLVFPLLAVPVGLSPLPFFAKGVLFDWDQGIMLSLRFGPKAYSVMIDVDIARAKSGADGAGIYPGQGILAPAVNDEKGMGEASMHPAFHGRVAVSINPVPLFSMVLGVVGHYYQVHTSLAYTNLNTFYGINVAGGLPGFQGTSIVPSKSMGLQGTISVWIFTLKGSGWMGENVINFTGSNFGAGWRESTSGRKNLAEKGRGGYCGISIVGPKVGIPVMLFFQVGQEIKNNNKRIPNATAIGTYSVAGYAFSAVGGATSTIKVNSEVSGGLWIFLNQYLKVGYECGQMVTKFQGVSGTSTNIVHRATASYTF